MRVGLGVSIGSEVVCGALVIAEEDGTATVDYRTVSADRQANTDGGDLVTSAIDLISSLSPTTPSTIAVSYRTPEQAAAIRSAVAHTRRSVNLVSESAAALAFLSSTGLVDRYQTVAIVDLGASGLTVTVVDRATGVVHAGDRTEQVGGDVLDRVVKDLVRHMAEPSQHDMRDNIRDDHGTGSARYRAVKEQLTTSDEALVERYSGPPLVVTRSDFEAAVGRRITSAADFARTVFAQTSRVPEALVMIGGGARIPLLQRTFDASFDVPVLVADEPDSILAKGAAYVALSAPGGRYSLVQIAGGERTRTLSRASGALVAATVAGGLVLAYGIQALAPSDSSSVSPAGSAASETSRYTTPAADAGVDPVAEPSGTVDDLGSTIANSRTSELTPALNVPEVDVPSISVTRPTQVQPSPTPSLHPAPDLPLIPWPTLPAPPRTTTPQVSPVTPPTATPPEPTTTPAQPTTGFPELELPPPTTSPTVPTTEADAPQQTTQQLTPPPTVWKPPATEPLTSQPSTPQPSPAPAERGGALNGAESVAGTTAPAPTPAPVSAVPNS